MAVLGSADHIKVDLDSSSGETESQVKSPGAPANEEKLQEEEEEVESYCNEVVSS